MKLLNSSSSHGWVRRFLKWGVGWAVCLLMCTEPVRSIVMYNFGVGPRGPYISANLEGPQSNLLFWGRAETET